MGWFTSSKTPEETETGTTTRQNRQKCWESRDLYFACLDREGVIKAGEEGKACALDKKQYEENCAKSWVEYFNQRRVIAAAQKDRLARAAAQAAETSTKSGRW